ncbi:MAG: acyl carrier protein [Burkholderiaceae bacterium]
MNDSQLALRRLVIDWLDDEIHFGEAETLIGDDERSFLANGVLDSLGFVKLILFLENSCGVRLDPQKLTPENFDSLGKIVRHVSALPGFRAPA